jgi:hypothetical protein
MGPIDLDWYLDLASFGYGLLPALAYPTGKSLWNYIRNKPYSNIYTPSEANAVSALINFTSLNELFGDLCKEECP